ncbi:MAG: diphthamide synthesis protein [Candidatus Pacearchaeota archaeon]|nr:diphthamide synthesis protein [Candidatus Pacearchaeota archaeon]
MKTLFIEAKKKSFPEFDLRNLPERIHLLYTIQFKPLALEIKAKLGKRVKTMSQVLGCSRVKPKADLFLLGNRFHALNLAVSSNTPVKYLDGEITVKDIETEKAKEKAKISRFYLSNNIAILVSTKPGQNKLSKALILKKRLQAKFKEKNFFLFLADNINLQELENFPIDLWLNTACQGLELDSSRILNYEKII